MGVKIAEARGLIRSKNKSRQLRVARRDGDCRCRVVGIAVLV